MNTAFIEKCHTCLYYERKEGTKNSYYLKQGAGGILPERLSFGIIANCKHSNKLQGKISEVSGQYKLAEEGLYYNLNNRKVFTSIWGCQDYPEIFGYGIIDERFKIFDLLIFYSENNCHDSFEVHLFRGMGKPEYLQQTFDFIRTQKKKPQ